MIESGKGAQERLSRLREYLAVDPGNGALRGDVFAAALAAGRREVAAELVAQALAERPDDPLWRHRRITLLLAERRYDEARAELEELRDRGVGEPAILHDLAFIHLRQGRFEEAASLVAPLRDGQGEVAGAAWAMWLRCQHRRFGLAEGLEAFRPRAADPELSGEALGVASLVALDAGSTGEAEAWSRAALGRAPHQLEALVVRGTLALSANDATAAQEWLGRALAVGPEDGRAWSAMGMARAMARDVPRADAAFAKAVETMPGHVGTWIAWGWCKLSLERIEEARSVFESALQLDGSFGESHGCLAVALARLGKREQATREIEVALRLDPNGLGARYAQAVLAGRVGDERVVRELTALALRSRGRA